MSVDVCVDDDCFAAPVPGASVLVSGAATEYRATTDANGEATVEVEGTGAYTVHAEWKTLNGDAADVSIGDDDSGVSIRLQPTFRAN
ncbi:carboxypeptidase regulatory-like domain-containing protein [Nocardioides lijunqiniae]|uniref:carboxypeptidase regulatory-like domain-containing protein n=1 Tax=Nocardioides lijunqiniae TaxID=2760832 RepID=UPI0018786F99|nr:carboxypeptidase regulatory-like domain-containing protein [Nocardioides lijunqiniae]